METINKKQKYENAYEEKGLECYEKSSFKKEQMAAWSMKEIYSYRGILIYWSESMETRW